MRHVAIITSGLVGITNASFKLVSKLQSEGYKVTYLCPIDIKEKVVNQNLNYIQLPEINFKFSFLKTPSLRKLTLSKFSKYVYHLTHLKSQYDEGTVQLNFDSYETILRDLQPDLLLVDEELHEIILVSIKLKLRIKLISQFFPQQCRYNLPPISTEIVPKEGLSGSQLGIFSAWSFVKSKIYRRLLIDQLTLKNNRRSLLKKYAKDIGFARKNLISRNFPSVFIHRTLPILSMTLSELDFSHAKPKNISYIGAMVREREHLKINNELYDILEYQKTSEAKLIYCSLTTMADERDIHFIKKVITAVKTEENWKLIISLGGKLSTHQFNNLPKNIYIFDWLPQLYVLSKVDCSINHGGIHTIHECIKYKVPMLIYSGKRYDQNGNAARIAYHSLGLKGDKDKDDSFTIRSKISMILSSNSIQNKINEMHNTLKIYESKKISSFL